MKINKKSLLFLLIGLLLICVAAISSYNLCKFQQVVGINTVMPFNKSSSLLVPIVTIGFGGFRGLLADWLWLRSTRLQEQGKYFELVKLADWITRLEPKSSAVWAFHAWNMAYNISIMMNTYEQRWQWVQHGIELLRDRGLLYNPKSAELYWELGWLFQHKIGGSSDSAHEYYKKAWMQKISDVFKGPRPDYKNLSLEQIFILENTYKLHIPTMQALEKKYGPLDWRFPATHSLYWAEQGKKYARGSMKTKMDRMIFQSLTCVWGQPSK